MDVSKIMKISEEIHRLKLSEKFVTSELIKNNQVMLDKEKS